MEKAENVRLAGICYESLVNGPGLRRVLFAQGCTHNCSGCFNPSTHSFEGGQLMDMEHIVYDIKSNPMLRGITFSGGECWEQADKFAYIAENVKNPNFNIWCYTGYTFEYILKHQNERKGWKDFLQNIDVLVDGKFDEEKKDTRIKFRGSHNQRIIDVKNSLSLGKVITLNLD